MSKPVIFMFSGQGSQFYQMGKELFEKDEVFKKWMLLLDSQAKKILNASVLEHMYDNNRKKSDLFNQLLYSHPAIFIIEYALAMVLIENGIKPDYVLGTSMGEFTSAAIAGIISFEDALHILIEQARIIIKKCKEGGMVAILHDSSLYSETPMLYENSELAGINFDSHFVISGSKNNLEKIEAYLKSKGITYQSLPVLYPFHSSLIDSVEEEYVTYLKKYSYASSKIPLISCSQTDMLNSISAEHLWSVIRKPINFQNIIKKLEEKNSSIYLDLGPSGTLATFIKYNLREGSKSENFSVLTFFGQDLKNLNNVKNFFQRENIYIKNLEGEKMKTYVFPGQGSQKKGMGADVFNSFNELVSKADAVLGYSIKELCLDDPHNQLGQTQYTQPALFVVNALTYLKKIEETKKKPDYVAGHSLGEYNALFAAGAFDFETGLKLVKKRGELMSQASGGGMAAVIGLTEEKINKVLKNNSLNNISIANFNSPSQIVLSGLLKEIEQAKSIFESAGAQLYIPLKVSGAFHTQFMKTAMEEFDKFLSEYTLSELSIPVISNVYARPYKKDEIKQTIVQQIANPVKWTESIQYLMGKGEMEFEEVGPGNVLSGLIKKIKTEAKPLIIDENEEKKTSNQEMKVEEKKSKTDMNSIDTKANEKQKVENISNQEESKSKAQKSHNKKDFPQISIETLGSAEYKKDYNVKYAYATGSMYRAIASKEMVVKMGKASMMGYFGTGGLSIEEIESAIKYIQNELKDGQAYGMNILYNPVLPQLEEATVDVYLKYKVRNVEASAFMDVTPSLVRYRLKGLVKNADGKISMQNRIMAKVSRPEVAEVFLSPAPERIIKKLLESGKITQEEADLAKDISMIDDLCVEADSGGHTDQGVAYTLMPAMIKLRNEMMEKYNYSKKIRVGAAGGIGTPESAAAAFILGADFIITGSINQCTVEAGTSDVVKDLLEQMNVQDTDYAPAGDMFEMGAKVQVLKKGLFFPARANKLYDLYKQFNSLDEIDDKTKKQIQEKYFKKNFNEIFADVKKFYPPQEVEKAERNPKHKMALIFKWYFGYSTRIALAGQEENRVDFQVHCGPALGAFNQWVKGTEIQSWRKRHVDEIAEKLMHETADLLNNRFKDLVLN